MATVPLITITEGWTGPLDLQLRLNQSALLGSGMTVSDIILRDKDGQRVPITGDWLDAALGTVRLLPSKSTFQSRLAPYTLKFEIRDGTGLDVYFPQSDPEQIQVRTA